MHLWPCSTHSFSHMHTYTPTHLLSLKDERNSYLSRSSNQVQATQHLSTDSTTEEEFFSLEDDENSYAPAETEVADYFKSGATRIDGDRQTQHNVPLSMVLMQLLGSHLYFVFWFLSLYELPVASQYRLAAICEEDWSMGSNWDASWGLINPGWVTWDLKHLMTPYDTRSQHWWCIPVHPGDVSCIGHV